jgi:hypothetical protein
MKAKRKFDPNVRVFEVGGRNGGAVVRATGRGGLMASRLLPEEDSHAHAG